MLERLLSYPQRWQVKIDFNLKKKTLHFCAPIYSAKKLPIAVKDYVLARKNLNFKPHATSYSIDGEKVFLTQELPFPKTFQSGSRIDIGQFLKLSKQCHQMLREIANEKVFSKLSDGQ